MKFQLAKKNAYKMIKNSMKKLYIIVLSYF